MRSAKLIHSMSRKGCSPDNAACESFLGRLKAELFSQGPGKIQLWSNSSRPLTPTFVGIARSASGHPSAHSVLLNSGRALGLRHKPVQIFCPGVLEFELLEPLSAGHAHAAKLAALQVITGLQEAVPAAQLGHRQSRFGFPQEANDLLFCISLLHVQSPVIWDWTPVSAAT